MEVCTFIPIMMLAAFSVHKKIKSSLLRSSNYKFNLGTSLIIFPNKIFCSITFNIKNESKTQISIRNSVNTPNNRISTSSFTTTVIITTLKCAAMIETPMKSYTQLIMIEEL